MCWGVRWRFGGCIKLDNERLLMYDGPWTLFPFCYFAQSRVHDYYFMKYIASKVIGNYFVDLFTPQTCPWLLTKGPETFRSIGGLYTNPLL